MIEALRINLRNEKDAELIVGKILALVNRDNKTKNVEIQNEFYKLFDLHLLGVPPIPLGADGENIILPYLKPCRGSFVLRIQGKKVFFEGCRLVQCLKKPELSFKLIQTGVRFLETFSNHRRV